MNNIKKLMEKRKNITVDPITQPTTGVAFVIFEKVIFFFNFFEYLIFNF
jgi:hypothetical protein